MVIVNSDAESVFFFYIGLKSGVKKSHFYIVGVYIASTTDVKSPK